MLYQRLITILWTTAFLGILQSPDCLAQRKTAVDDEMYSVEMATLRNGKSVELEIAIFPKENVHCNLEYPWKVLIKESRGIVFSKERYTKNDATVFSEKQVVFKVPVSKFPKDGVATLELKFSLCNATQCFMKKVPIQYKGKQ
ncbi:MAG: hypothetical protein JXR76_24260 [Deltaproteobacteria bacterium]|nr:hypothetical protein [Deltaproteobacteria bacterium]